MTVIDPYEHPDHVNPETAAVVEDAAPEYTDLNLQRRFRFIFALGIVGVLFMGLMAWLLISSSTGSSREDSLRKRNESLTNTVEAQQLLIDKLAVQLDEARAQGAAVPAPEVVAAETPGADVSPPEGVQGERGDAGAPGEAGTSGDVGVPGLTGATGDEGAIGPRGLPGVAGADGSPGATGAAGADGVDGAPGANGSDGADGAPGAAGPTGPAGATGATGGMPVTYHFTFNGVAYTCTQIASGSTTYNCTVD